MNIITLWDDVNFQINKDGGYLSIADFNRLSQQAELKLLDYISGDEKGQAPPILGLAQKNDDWISQFTLQYQKYIQDGLMDKPSDYYSFNELHIVNGTRKNDEGKDLFVPDTSIELLTTSKYTYRANTFIKELKPSITNPISKIVANRFEFVPKDIGIVQLTYIRYPVFGKIVSKIDQLYNDVVPDEVASQNYEWNEWARPYLIFWITDLFANRTREQALKQFNQITQQAQA